LKEERDNLLNNINILKQTRLDDIYKLAHPPSISIPPNNQYVIQYEINNGLFGTKGDVYLQQIMGISPYTVAYRNHFLFQNRRLPRPYNEPLLSVNVNYPKD
jgi:hypothetical protein